MEYKKTETEFDLRTAGLELIGALSQEVRISYREAIKNQSVETVQDYYSELSTLFIEIKRFVDLDQDEQKEKYEFITEVLQESYEELNSDISYQSDLEKVFKKLEECDEKLQELRNDVNLDIPRKKEYDKDEAGLAGLR